MIFKDRNDAAQKLAARIAESNIRDAVVLGLPRGGVVIAKQIADKLGLKMDIIITRKIGAPFNKEYAIGAVSENELVINETGDSKEYIEKEVKLERKEIERRKGLYRGNKKFPNIKNKTVILVDDGLATGLTMLVAVREAKILMPKKIIIAVPVAPPDTVSQLKKIVDEIIVLNIESDFFAVGQFYQKFNQVSDEKVKALLK